MKCPIDQAELIMTERHGVEIDYCPKCRGVWLDRGELDKIIEKAAGAFVPDEPAPPPPPPGARAPEPQVWQEPYRREERRFDDERGYRDGPRQDRRDRDDDRKRRDWDDDRKRRDWDDDDKRYYGKRRDREDDDRRYYGKRRKRDSLLSEIFDIFD
ncbi:MAG: zf-TFIIB domain-containing protein [Pseudomonadota bacterium]